MDRWQGVSWQVEDRMRVGPVQVMERQFLGFDLMLAQDGQALATIRAVSSDLQGDTPYDDETRAELLALVSDEAERLDRLVANLLSMSRVEAGSFDPDLQAVDLGELIDATLARMRRLVREHRIEREVDADLPLVSADYVQIELVPTDEYPDLPDVAETGTTFAENALLKAHAVAAATGTVRLGAQCPDSCRLCAAATAAIRSHSV